MTPIWRTRRKVMGGLVDIRVYPDGSARIRVDHPSNDPEIEYAMVGRVVRVAREVWARNGWPEPKFGPMAPWKSDP